MAFTVTTLHLLSPYVRSFQGADEVVKHLAAIGYLHDTFEDDRPRAWAGVELTVNRDSLLIGEPLKRRHHRIDCDSKAELNGLRGQMKQAGL